MKYPPVVSKFATPDESPCLEAAIDALEEFGMDHLALTLKLANVHSLPLRIVEARYAIGDTMKVLDRATDDRRWGTALGQVLPLLKSAAKRANRLAAEEVAHIR